MAPVPIFICCYHGDFFLTKILCASIRHFYEDVPIILIKDGDFDTQQLKVLGNISEFNRAWVPASLRGLKGMGSPKLLIFFQEQFERFLYIDSDAALVSPIFELPFEETDFYVDTSYAQFYDSEKWDLPKDDSCFLGDVKWIQRYIFNPKRVELFDPSFDFQSLTLFNSGQFFGRSGIFELDEMLTLLQWHHEHKGLFALNDQGILNYLINKGVQEKRFTLAGSRFKIGGGYEQLDSYPELSTDSIRNRNFRKRRIIHWAGVNQTRLDQFPFAFVLQEFDSEYYHRLPTWTRLLDTMQLKVHFALDNALVEAYNFRQALRRVTRQTE